MARQRQKAILIPANPSRLRNPALGSILLHARHAERYGKVFWDVFPPTIGLPGPFPHKGIRVAYFYDAIDRLVRYKAKVHSVYNGRELSKVKYGKRHLLEHRRDYYGSESRGYWVLLSDFLELEKPLRLRRFLLWSNGTPVRQVRRYAIVRDPQLKTIR